MTELAEGCCVLSGANELSSLPDDGPFHSVTYSTFPQLLKCYYWISQNEDIYLNRAHFNDLTCLTHSCKMNVNFK